MERKEAQYLLQKYREGICSEEERALVESWYLNWKTGDMPELEAEDFRSDLEEMSKGLPILKPGRKRVLIQDIGLAAAIVVFLSFGLYFALSNKKEIPAGLSKSRATDIVPGGNKAILTLADGSRVTLNSAANGEIAQQSGISITKTAEGQLVYSFSKTEVSKTGSAAYNTIETPRGGQYRVDLPDGTRVWLNAASSLHFPISFAAHERRVELKGEAYFEVTKNKSAPFRIRSGNEEVEVLGTRFNMNTYPDEKTSETTLLEGSVKITRLSDHSSKLIQPGEQAQIGTNGITIIPADTEEAVAWKNGLFKFTDADIESVMRQVARWYDVEIEYEGEKPQIAFTGKLHRNVNISQVLEILSYFKVHFRIEGKKIIVTP